MEGAPGCGTGVCVGSCVAGGGVGVNAAVGVVPDGVSAPVGLLVGGWVAELACEGPLQPEMMNTLIHSKTIRI